MIALDPYVDHLRRGEVVACATETLFGLLADARSEAAVARVVALKKRGSDPIALLAPNLELVETVAELDARARELAERHWPGPLTLILRARPGLPAAIDRAGTVGVRIPGPSPALDLVRTFGGLLTATSCNPSGLPAARTPEEAAAYFRDLIPIFPSAAPGGPASTILDLTGETPRVLRQGAIEVDRHDD